MGYIEDLCKLVGKWPVILTGGTYGVRRIIIEGTLKPDVKEGSAVQFFPINQLPEDMDPDIIFQEFTIEFFRNQPIFALLPKNN
ncbi:hypothetical protein ACXM0N_18110 [Peribacillus simplex]